MTAASCRRSSTGYHSSWKTSGGPPWSRAICAITAEMLPPAESPATAIRAGSPPNSAACSPTHRSAAHASSSPRVGVLGGQPVVHRHHDGFRRRRRARGPPRRGCRGRRSTSRRRGRRPPPGRLSCSGIGRPVDTDRDVGQVAVADRFALRSAWRAGFWRRPALSRSLAGHLDTVVDGEPERKSIEHRLQSRVDARPRRRGVSHESTVGIGRLKRKRVRVPSAGWRRRPASPPQRGRVHRRPG